MNNKIRLMHVVECAGGVDTVNIRKTAALSMISRRDVGIPEDAHVIGMVGRISPQKAPDVFVRMASEVVKKIRKADCRYCGGYHS